ncbi:alanine racemase [Chromohalobacter canadensis]|uniref:alanine racemase n=1 Tax=Chromohalobacter canadensis TaxID=141389 RepID=UPI00240F22A3|nr:alanine racemase [Chromohalobacter canadensis]
MSRPLIADIDLGALRHNYRLACDQAPQSRAMAVLKAGAYGHGAVECANALADVAPAFAVASLEEAVALREAGIAQPIMLLEGFFDATELPLIDSHRLWVAAHSDWQIDALLAFRPRAPIPTWLKLDSGMHRLGFAPEDFVARWQRLKAAPAQVADLHLMTHFATADALDPGYFRRQLACAEALRERLAAPVCLANSPATLAWPQTHGAWTRPGVMLYGSDPLEGANDASRALKPVMTLRSEIIAVRELATGEAVGYGGRWRAPRPSRIGVVACGYGDGYDRHARDGTPVLVDGRRVPLAGKVSMDMLTVDLTDVPEAAIGSRVVLWGEGLSIDEVARHCDTISYTLMTGVLPRVPRRYRVSDTV